MGPAPPSARVVALLALGYLVLGMAGLLLAIPPGYASPVFPAAGLALACVLRFGWRALPGRLDRLPPPQRLPCVGCGNPLPRHRGSWRR